MHLRLGEFGPVRVFGRTLVIVCSYRGCAGQQSRLMSRLHSLPFVRRLVDIVTLGPLRRHVGAMRDHYANPRPAAAQIGIVTALLEQQSRPESVKAVFDARTLPNESQPRPSWAVDAQTVDLASWVPSARDVDTVILSYPDALGLTFGRLESRLLAAGARNVVILTGRRRLFPLSSQAVRALRSRRLLASTRIVELMAAIIVLPVAGVLAGYDWLTMDKRPLR